MLPEQDHELTRVNALKITVWLDLNNVNHVTFLHENSIGDL
jgi:hypothetical protein